MAAMTYARLVAEVPDTLYAANRSLVEKMPLIVSDAEERLWQVMDHDLFQEVLTPLTVGSGADPSLIDLSGVDLLEVRAVALQYQSGSENWPALERRDLEFLRMLYASGRPARPKFYAEYGSQLVLKVFPFPDQEYPVEITANIRPPQLGPATQENRISRQYGRALKKAVLLEGSLYMKDWTGAERYEKEMVQALGEANAAISRKRRDETDTRPIETANATGM